MKRTLLVILSVMGVAGWTSVQAQLIDVNFIDDSINVAYGGGSTPAPATMSGAAAVGSAGDIWNGLGGLAYSAYPLGATAVGVPLVDSTGAATPVTLSLSAPNGTYGANSVNWNNHSTYSYIGPFPNLNENAAFVLTPTLYSALTGTMLVANTAGNPGNVTLSGLAPNQAFDLYLYNAGDANIGAGRTSTFIVNGITQTSTWMADTHALVAGDSYTEYVNAMSDGAGNLVITFGDGSGVTESDLNGLQLQAVPEPGTLALLASGAVLLLGYQRRKALRA
jgi:hypothetical protein